MHGEQRLLVNYLLHLLGYALRFTFFSFEISPLLVLSVDLRAEIEVGLYYKFLCLPTGPKDCGHSFLPWHVIPMVLISRKNALWMYFPGNNLNFSLESLLDSAWTTGGLKSSISSPHTSWRLIALVSHIPGLRVIRTWTSRFSALTPADKGILIFLSLLGLSLSGSLSFLFSWLSAALWMGGSKFKMEYYRYKHTLGLGIKRGTLGVTVLITFSWWLAFGLQ